MAGNRTRGSKLDSQKLDTGKINAGILDPISFCRTAVLIWLLGLLVLLSACGAEARSVGLKPSHPPHRVADAVPDVHAASQSRPDPAGADAGRNASVVSLSLVIRRCGVDTPARSTTGLTVSPAKDTCNAQAAWLLERPHLPDAEVGKLHIRRVVVDISPDTGSPNESGDKPATWASLHRPAVTAGRCIFLTPPTVPGACSIG